MDLPLISKKETEELNRLRQPLVVPHLDGSGWLVQERKVIDFRGSISLHLREHPYMEAIPNSLPSQEVRSLGPLQGGDSRNS